KEKYTAQVLTLRPTLYRQLIDHVYLGAGWSLAAQNADIVNDALADDLKTYGSEVIPQHENSKAIFWKNGEPLK
ncbi:hypothetical protein AB8Q71_26940, partial [Klebsiella pneumoniae]